MINTIPLTQHFSELKLRGSYLFLTVTTNFLVCYNYLDQLLFLLVTPLGRNFIFTYMPEVFFTGLKLSIVVAIIVTLPLFALQSTLFLAPGLYNTEKLFVAKVSLALLGLFYLGLLSAYKVVIPAICNLFLTFELLSPYLNIELTPKISEYYTLVSKLLFITSQFFQLPVYLFLVIKYNLIKLSTLADNKKAISAGILLVVAAISPPDFVIQAFLFAVLFCIYELSLVWLHIIKKYWQLNK